MTNRLLFILTAVALGAIMALVYRPYGGAGWVLGPMSGALAILAGPVVRRRSPLWGARADWRLASAFALILLVAIPVFKTVAAATYGEKAAQVADSPAKAKALVEEIEAVRAGDASLEFVGDEAQFSYKDGSFSAWLICDSLRESNPVEFSSLVELRALYRPAPTAE